MRAVRQIAGSITVVEVPEPEGQGERVAVRAVGICGSDLQILAAGLVSGTIGHEFAGVLDDGTPVAVEPVAACGTCDQCRVGDYQRCRQARGGSNVYGVGLDGGMADYVRVPPERLVRLPAGLPVSDGCLVEPLAVCIHGLRMGGLRGGERVAVVGAGNIGLLALAAARALGCEVGLVARHPTQIDAGERLGASEASGEYEIVVEAAGSESALDRAAELAGPGATLVLLGVYPGRIGIPGGAALTKELKVVSSYMYGRHTGGRDVDAAASLLAANPGIARAVVTHRFPLEAAAEAFRVAADRKAGAIKVIVEP